MTFFDKENVGRKPVSDFTLVEKMSDTLPLLVFVSLERKDDPVKRGESETFPLSVFMSFERKDDPCKTGGGGKSSILPLLKI